MSMDKLTDKAVQIIDSMASKLGVAADHMIQVYSKQVMIEGVQTLITGVILLIILFFATKALRPLRAWHAQIQKKGWDTDFFEDVAPIAAYVIYIIFFVIVVIFFIADVPEAIGKLLNPEYYMIKDIINMFK